MLVMFVVVVLCLMSYITNGLLDPRAIYTVYRLAYHIVAQSCYSVIGD